MDDQSSKVDFNDWGVSFLTEPYIYRKNPFQILSLSLDSTVRDIQRKQKQLSMFAKLGSSSSINERLLPNTLPAPSSEDINAAFLLLQHPNKRVLCELFWFWLNGDCDVNKEAMRMLKDSQSHQALTLWNDNIKEDKAGRFVHNSAILSHLLALESEFTLRNKDMTDEYIGTSNMLWSQAYDSWNHLLSNEKFWEVFAERMKRLNDPRLKASHVKQIRRSIPSLLLAIHSKIILDYAVSNNNIHLIRHKDLIVKAGFSHPLVLECLKDALSPSRKQLKILCGKIESDFINAGNNDMAKLEGF